MSNVGLIFHDQVTYLEPIFPKIEAYFGLQGVRVNCSFFNKVFNDANNTSNRQLELNI